MSGFIDELLRIYRRDGKLTPDAVVDEARSDRSPLHTHFTWDDSQAADKWRLAEARTLIRKAQVIIETEEKMTKVRAFVNLADEAGEHSYVPTADVLADPALSEQLLRQLRRDIQVMVRRYERFSEATQLVEALQEWLTQHAA